MATRKNTPAAMTDASNASVLSEREQRLNAEKFASGLDLGLGLKGPEAASAVEFLNDEFDRKAFGDPQATIKRIIYGPDPLVDGCPELRDALERYGLEDYAEATAEAIRRNGSKAVPNVMIQRSLSGAIKRFGAESVANAFRDRILRIPFREVEIDASDTPDMDLQGSQVLADTIRRYERAGYGYRFFSSACVDRLGWRGYTPVKNPNGDIVKAGTLMLGEARQERIDARRERLAQESAEAMEGIAEAQIESQQRDLEKLRSDGYRTNGVSVLDPGEVVTAGYAGTDNSSYAGQTRNSGVQITREPL